MWGRIWQPTRAARQDLATVGLLFSSTKPPETAQPIGRDTT